MRVFLSRKGISHAAVRRRSSSRPFKAMPSQKALSLHRGQVGELGSLHSRESCGLFFQQPGDLHHPQRGALPFQGVLAMSPSARASGCIFSAVRSNRRDSMSSVSISLGSP